MQFDVNKHDEVDTLMINGIEENTNVTFFSHYTDVLVLAMANFDELLHNTSISMTFGKLQIKALWRSLGLVKAKALPSVHAFSRGDSQR